MGDRLTPEEIEQSLTLLDRLVAAEVSFRGDEFTRARVEYSRNLISDQLLSEYVRKDNETKTAAKLWQILRSKAGQL